jgi:signal transduction histidine kinase
MAGISGWFDQLINGANSKNSSKGNSRTLPPSKRISKLEEELARLRAVYRGTAELNATLNYERVLDLALDLATTALDESSAEGGGLVSALLLFRGDELTMVSARGLVHADRRRNIPGTSGAVERALSSGQLTLAENPANDPELGRFLAFQRCRAAVCIPLVVGLEVYGLMVFGHPRHDYLTEEGLELLEAIAQQAIVALQNAKLYRDLELEKERISEIQEQARKKLARDLHDGPAQSVGAIAMRVNFARRLVNRDAKSASDELFKIEELARRTSKEIRQMLFTLRPLVLESKGLVAALEDLSEKTKETHGQHVIVEADPKIGAAMEVGKQGVVFFIAEEAVANARKHAKAHNIWIRLRQNGDLAFLEVEDDGIGFDLSSVEDGYEKRGSLGMVNLHERAELVNGALRIDTAPGKGTKVSVSIPLTVEAAERMHTGGFNGVG